MNSGFRTFPLLIVTADGLVAFFPPNWVSPTLQDSSILTEDFTKQFLWMDKGKSILLRLLNVAMTSQESVLLLGDPLATVEKVDLAGHKQSALSSKDGAPPKIVCGLNELVTLRITQKT